MSFLSYIALRFDDGRLTAVAPWAFSPTGAQRERELIWQAAPASVAELILDTMCPCCISSWGRRQALPEEMQDGGTFAVTSHLAGEAVFVAIDLLTFTATLREYGSWALRTGPKAQMRFFEALDEVRYSIKEPPHVVIDRATFGRVLELLEVAHLHEDGQPGEMPVNFFGRLGKVLEKDRRARRSREKAGQPHGGTHAVL